MNPSSATDTDSTTRSRYLDLIAAVPPAERLHNALALTALVRDLAWEGATLHYGHLGNDAVVARFALQLYGPDIAERIVSSLSSSA
jgi:hypothetical protein